MKPTSAVRTVECIFFSGIIWVNNLLNDHYPSNIEPFFQWDSPFISSNHGTSMVLPWLDIGCLGVKKFDRWSFLAVWWFDEWCDIIWLVVTGTFGLFSIIYTNGETWNINGILIWLVVWNMAFMTFHNIWECHRPNWRTPSFFRGVGEKPPTSHCRIRFDSTSWPSMSNRSRKRKVLQNTLMSSNLVGWLQALCHFQRTICVLPTPAWPFGIIWLKQS